MFDCTGRQGVHCRAWASAGDGFQKGRRDTMNMQNTTGATKDLEGPYAYAAKNAVGHDGSLVTQAKSGDASAFGALYERHCSKIYRIAFRILRNRQDAEDAVQRCFQHAFTNLRRFREGSTFSTWVTRIAINEALMLVRQRRSDKVLSEECNDGMSTHSRLDVSDDRPTPEQAMTQTELRNTVIHAISKLRHNLRVVVVLRLVHGLTSVEIARNLGLTVAAVKGRTFHAKRHLRRYLERKFEGAHAAFLIGVRD